MRKLSVEILTVLGVVAMPLINHLIAVWVGCRSLITEVVMAALIDLI